MNAGASHYRDVGSRAGLYLSAKPLEQAPWETGDRGWRGFVSLWAGF